MKGRTGARLLTLLGTLLMMVGLVLALSPLITNVRSQAYVEYDPELLTPSEEFFTPQEVEVYSTYGMDMPYRMVEEPEQEIILEFDPNAKGILAIPSLNIMFEIGYGIEVQDINTGPSFYPQSSHPLAGNVAIAGHRTTYGAPFRHLDQLNKGDEITLSYDNVLYTYQVDKVHAVNSRDWTVIYDYDEPTLTLTTCHPPGWATQRLVVRAHLLSQ